VVSTYRGSTPAACKHVHEKNITCGVSAVVLRVLNPAPVEERWPQSP
jgi:hypothetical protein